MFKITMIAGGISPEAGQEAAEDIQKEFRENRPWHEQATCSFANGTLTLTVVNDHDENGLGLSDEFSDCLTAFVMGDISDDGEFRIVSVETI